MIDGGKGQLSAALAAMQAYDLPRVAVIALAKRVEEVFVPGRPDPIVLDRTTPGLQLLQRIRDEAHRFALGFHRQRRDARARESIFDTLQGVGPARRRALLRHFGSAERFLAASAGGARGRPGRAGEDGAARSTRSCTRPAGRERAGRGRAARRVARPLLAAISRPYFWATRSPSSGSWFHNLAAALLIYRLTGSELLLGILSFSQFAAIVVFSPWAGAAADRFDRRQLLSSSELAAAVLSATLAVLAFAGEADGGS